LLFWTCPPRFRRNLGGLDFLLITSKKKKGGTVHLQPSEKEEIEMTEKTGIRTCPECQTGLLILPVKKPEGVFEEATIYRACNHCGTIYKIKMGGIMPYPGGERKTKIGILPEVAVRLAAERMIPH